MTQSIATTGSSTRREFTVERLKALLTTALERFTALPSRQKLVLSIAGAFLLLGAVASIWTLTRPSWRILYSGLDPQEAREMGEQLTAANITFDVSPDGTILRVPADALDKARLQTAAKGGPKSGRLGFELFDKPNWIGSEFDERVNYQRALEGELEHTIASLGSVQSARVHLVLPHDSLFSEQQREAKASVVLKLRRRRLSDDEVEAIRNLVASAVDDLSPANVMLVDADGRSSFGRKSADAGQAEHEQILADRLIATLEPTAGAGNVRASVNVEYETASADEVDETFDPNATVTLTMQRSEQESGERALASGVPGTQSNAPNVKPPLFPSNAPQVQSLKEESGTYGASKRVRHTVQGPGRVRRITAAVLVNDRLSGQAGRSPWRAEELKHITDLSQAAIGFDAARGDVVSVENISFEAAPDARPPWTERLMGSGAPADLIRYAAMLLALLLLILFVFRPALRGLGAAHVNRGVAPELSFHTVATDETTSVLESEAASELPRPNRQLLFQKVSQLVHEDAGQSARLVQSWIDLS